MRQTNTALSYGGSNYPGIMLACARREAALYNKEQAFIKILEARINRSAPTLTDLWIMRGIDDDRAAFRKLIQEMKEQLKDAPDGLRGVIGQEAVGMLKNL